MGRPTYLITGAGSGIGRSIAVRISKKDKAAGLILVGRNEGALRETAELLEAPAEALVHRCDLTSLGSIQSLGRALRERGVALSGLVMNAGVAEENHYGEHDLWDEILATNLTGQYQLTRELLPLLRLEPKEYKNIVYISSNLARVGVPKYSAYCASKAGILGLTRSLAVELAAEKILVNAVCPGWVKTKMADKGVENFSKNTGLDLAAAEKTLLANVPLGKMCDPEEVAELVYFLLSGVQASITGQTFDINNGSEMP